MWRWKLVVVLLMVTLGKVVAISGVGVEKVINVHLVRALHGSGSVGVKYRESR